MKLPPQTHGGFYGSAPNPNSKSGAWPTSNKPGSLVNLERTYWNPPFDKRILNFPFLKGSNKVLQRGFMVDATTGRKGINFLYNPNTIALSHNSDASNSDVLPTMLQNPAQAPGHYNVPLNSSLSAAFFFDRTYDTWDGTYANTPQGLYGVLVDVYSFYYILGMVQSPIDFGSPPTGPMMAEPVRMFLGMSSSWVQGNLQASKKTVTKTLNFYGWITGLNVTYSHFTQSMTPNRAEVDVTLSLLPDTSDFQTTLSQYGIAPATTPPTTTGSDLPQSSSAPPSKWSKSF